MGFARVVLARELSLEEIAAIRAATTIGLDRITSYNVCYTKLLRKR